MSYDIFQPVHEDFRKSIREFIENELFPHADEWEEAEEFPREVFKRMGDLGFLGMSYPEEYGGDDDRLAEAVLTRGDAPLRLRRGWPPASGPTWPSPCRR